MISVSAPAERVPSPYAVPSPLLTPLRTCALVFTVAAALTFRLDGLSVYGFNEDEVAKVRAIESYRHGDFSANAEHPMLMKLAMWGSLEAAQQWTAHVPALAITPEAALRFPNAVAGGLTTLAVYGAAALLFDPAVGLVAAILVAADPTIISVNRIGKEDTFLMLFFLLAVFCYERAKAVWAADSRLANRLYDTAAVCFGLMLASKYLPHLFGLYALFNVAVMRRSGANAPRKREYYAAMLLAFVAANFAILLPGTWAYVLHYLAGRGLAHHGYPYNGQVYVNSATVLLWGVPWTYYFRLIATKMPTTVVAAALAAVPLLVIRRRQRGFVWLRVFLVIQLLGYAAFAAKFQRYALPLLVAIDVLAAVGLMALIRWMRQQSRFSSAVTVPLCAAALALLLLSVAQAPAFASPHFSIYQNLIGERLAAAATVYPEEAYDYGVREAVAAVGAEAGSGASIVSDADMTVDYYLRQAGRDDIASRSFSRDGLTNEGEQWVFVQDSHLSFENAALTAQLRATMRPWREYRLGGTSVLEVFKVVR